MAYELSASGAVLSITFDSPLTANREYTISILAGLSGVYGGYSYILPSDYIFSFTSTYCPLFTTLTRVKLEAGPGVDILTDDTIYRIIHKNSLDAVDLYNYIHSTTIAYDYWGCTWHDVPLVLRRYVECKSAYDLLSLLKISGAGLLNGAQTKTLGDMTIKYGGSGGSGSGSPNDGNKLKDLYNCWQEAKRSMQTIRVAVKGYWDDSKGFSHPVRDVTNNRIIAVTRYPINHHMTPGYQHNTRSF